MRNTGKQSTKPSKPAAIPAILPVEPDSPETEQQQGEGSYSGTRDYQASIRGYLETANVEKDARNAAPDNVTEARDLENAEQKGRRPGIKTKRPTNK